MINCFKRFKNLYDKNCGIGEDYVKREKIVLLGVTGSIAAYKIATLASSLKNAGM